MTNPNPAFLALYEPWFQAYQRQQRYEQLVLAYANGLIHTESFLIMLEKLKMEDVDDQQA